MTETPAFQRFIYPDPDIWLDEFASKEYLFPKTARFPGNYDLQKTPYAREILRELTPLSPTRKVVFVKPTQVGGTEIANVFIFGCAVYYSGPMQMTFPNEKMRDKHVEEKINPVLASNSELLRGILLDYDEKKKKRSSKRELLRFAGGSCRLNSIQGADAIRSDSIRYVIATDVDSDQFYTNSEGDPLDLLEKRMDSYGFDAKFYIESTPRVKGISLIEKEYLGSSQGRYHVPCLKCGKYHFLEFGGKEVGHGFKFKLNSARRPLDAWFVCPQCGRRIDEKEKFEMMIEGRYWHRYNDNPVRGFMINAFYSPVGFVSWIQIAGEWIKAYQNRSKLQVFFNTRLALSFETAGMKQPEYKKLMARADNYKMLTVPNGGLLLTMGVDTQDNRLVITIYAIGRHNEAWLIYWGELHGDPNLPDVWAQVDSFLYRNYEHESGGFIKVSSCAVDMGGHRGDAVKEYARLRYPLVIPVKGAASVDAPVLSRPKQADVNYKGGYRRVGAVGIWMVGVHSVKLEIYSRLLLEGNGPNRFHFPNDAPEEYYAQLTAEKLIKKIVGGREVERWENVRPGGRNEALDCTVYGISGITRVKAGADFQKIEDSIKSHAKPRKKEREKKTGGGFEW